MNKDNDRVHIADFPTGEAASKAGATLLELGIVATVSDDDQPGDDDTVSLLVEADDVPRACEILGLAAPVAQPLPLSEPIPVERTRWRLPREQLGVFIIGYLVVLVALSVAVFYVVVWLLGGYDSTEVPNVTVPN